MNKREKPEGYDDALSDYKACLFDSWCGKPVAWGFEILKRISDKRFAALGDYGSLECSYPTWFLIVRRLTRVEAVTLYGPVSAEGFGPRGGWKSVTFGTTKFISRSLREPRLRPEDTA